MGCGTSGKCTYICPVSFGLALGILSAICMLLFGWSAWYFDYGTEIVSQYGSVYYGYAPTLVGGLIGGAWGLVEGFIAGYLLGIIYNFFMRRCHKSDVTT